MVARFANTNEENANVGIVKVRVFANTVVTATVVNHVAVHRFANMEKI